MDSTSGKQSSQSSGTEKTPDSDSGNSHAKRAYTKSSKSPSLKAFLCFEESMAQFLSHILTKNDQIGHDDVDTMKEFLNVLNTKCKNMETTFEGLISRLDNAIEDYEAKKPTDLAADANANCVMSTETPAQNSLAQLYFKNSCSISLFKGNQTIGDLFNVLNKDISKIYASIGKKIQSSIYVEYSFSMEKKLKNLKKMCENIDNELKQIGKVIERAIEKNETFRAPMES